MNRRDLTRSIFALSAGSMALHAVPIAAEAAPQAADDDAGLLSLCRRYMSLERRQDLLFDRECEAERAGDCNLARWLSDVQRQYVPYHHRLLAEIVNTKPKTEAGLLAKVRVFMSRVQRDLEGNPMGDEGPLWSLCRDLLGHDPGERPA
jgi:hypothetical protein